MIDIPFLIKKLQMQAVIERIAEHDAAHEIAKGVWQPLDDELLPAPVSESRRKAWLRAKKQTQSLGPRILTSKKQAVLGGGITWGGDDDRTDEVLKTLDLPKLANGLLENLIIDGMAAAMAHQDTNDVGEPIDSYKISRIGGYLQPYLKPNNIDEVVGIFQAWSSMSSSSLLERNNLRQQSRYDSSLADHLNYNVRVYDFETQSIKEWINIQNPTHLAKTPTNTYENAPQPRYAIMEKIDAGLPLGELLQACPTIKHHYGMQLMRALTAELSAVSMFYTKGDVEISSIGPAEVIAMPTDGDAGWLGASGNLEEINTLITILEERLRGDLSLSGGFLGNDSPSGEALKEANIKFRQNTQNYAETISDILTKAVYDLAELTGDFEPVEIAVLPSKDYDEAERRDTIIQLYDKGLIPLNVAATEIQSFFPTWSDDNLNEWIESQTRTVNIDDFNALAGETDTTG